MSNSTLNYIESNSTGWYSLVFDFQQINVGGVYISLDQFSEAEFSEGQKYQFRVYKKTKKLVVSGNVSPEFEYCALGLKYQSWRCLLCKKISKINESKCFCLTYSKCWTPLNFQINGVIFANDLNFQYHFAEDSFSNLPL
jgi:hypothetical protein